MVFLFQFLTFVEEDFVKNRKMYKIQNKKRQWSVETFITFVIIKDILFNGCMICIKFDQYFPSCLILTD